MQTSIIEIVVITKFQFNRNIFNTLQVVHTHTPHLYFCCVFILLPPKFVMIRILISPLLFPLLLLTWYYDSKVKFMYNIITIRCDVNGYTEKGMQTLYCTWCADAKTRSYDCNTEFWRLSQSVRRALHFVIFIWTYRTKQWFCIPKRETYENNSFFLFCNLYTVTVSISDYTVWQYKYLQSEFFLNWIFLMTLKLYANTIVG